MPFCFRHWSIKFSINFSEGEMGLVYKNGRRWLLIDWHLFYNSCYVRPVLRLSRVTCTIEISKEWSTDINYCKNKFYKNKTCQGD